MYWLLQLSVFKSMKSLTISLPGLHWTGADTDPPSISNISKTVSVNNAFTKICFWRVCDELITWRFINFPLVILYLLMFKSCGIIGISKIECFIFSGNFFHISKTVRASTVFTKTFFIEYLMRFRIICTLVNFSSVVL